MNKKEQTRLRVQRYRDKQKALQDSGKCNAIVTDDVTLEDYVVMQDTGKIKLSKLLDEGYRTKAKATLEAIPKKHWYNVRTGTNGVTLEQLATLIDIT